MITVCGKCGQALEDGVRKCSCGGDAVGLLEPGEKPPPEAEARRMRGRDIGAKLGEVLFKDSPFASLATAVGYTLGRVLEGKRIISFSKPAPEPKKIDIGKAIFGGGGKSTRKKRGKKKSKRVKVSSSSSKGGES